MALAASICWLAATPQAHGAALPHPAESADAAAIAAEAVAGEVLAEAPLGGLTIAVARGGKRFAKGYGEADVARHLVATGDTVYPICSISKQFAAAAILALTASGRIDLDAPLARYFSPDPLPEHRVTVRQLLNHTSGAGSYNEGPDWEAMQSRALRHDEILARIAGQPHAPPGVRWSYSNSGFYLAGLLVERVTGKSYWEFLASTFFEPLGMRSARPCATTPPGERARGYRPAGAGVEEAEAENWENPGAGGGLCMSAVDLLTWQAALDSGRALPPVAVRELRTPTRLDRRLAFDYGLGTRLGELAGHAVSGHTGNGMGFSTVLLHFPHDDLTIVVLRNLARGPDARIVGARLARRLLGLPRFAARDLPVPPALRQILAGKWLGDFGTAELQAVGDHLVAQLGEGGPPLPFAFQGGTTFTVGEEDEIRFDVRQGRSDLSQEYVGGLFDSAAQRPATN